MAILKRESLFAVSALLGVVLLSGCASKPTFDEEYMAAQPTYNATPPPQNGSIYRQGYGMSLFEDNLARRVGDVLTIVLSEQTNASKKSATNTSREADINSNVAALLGGAVRFGLPRPFGSRLDGRSLDNEISSATEFAGEGDSSLSNSLSGNVTVTVAEVLPNGNLFVRGQKRLTINQGDEYVQITGIVRPADIQPDNTVVSTRVADARISYVGEGTLADANSQGWLTRFFNSGWWPF